MTLSPRERFLALVFSQPPRQADAIVILAGEDAKPRLEMGWRAFCEGGAPLIVVSGGLDDPPSKLDAKALRTILIGKGLSPDRIILEAASQNTIDQASFVLDLARAHQWTRLMITASSYHLPRAILTFLQAMGDATETYRLIPLCANQSPWSGSPEGVSTTREMLLDVEAEKVELYRERGHCASYEAGVEYLLAHEGKP